ncbi:MAG: hypothetical protein ACYTGH_02005 [Planctomycetota bacterium]|jgi:hypothetical protein
MNSDPYSEFLNQVVVLDTATSLFYLGRLVEAGEYFLTLEEVDVQDGSRCQVAKEVYLMEALRDGINSNRERVKVKQSAVISISALDDVKTF